MHGFKIPNLDLLDKNELYYVEVVCKQISSYARSKQRAITHRKRGEIESAQFYEDNADLIYGMLPDKMKW